MVVGMSFDGPAGLETLVSAIENDTIEDEFEPHRTALDRLHQSHKATPYQVNRGLTMQALPYRTVMLWKAPTTGIAMCQVAAPQVQTPIRNSIDKSARLSSEDPVQCPNDSLHILP